MPKYTRSRCGCAAQVRETLFVDSSAHGRRQPARTSTTRTTAPWYFRDTRDLQHITFSTLRISLPWRLNKYRPRLKHSGVQPYVACALSKGRWWYCRSRENVNPRAFGWEFWCYRIASSYVWHYDLVGVLGIYLCVRSKQRKALNTYYLVFALDSDTLR